MGARSIQHLQADQRDELGRLREIFASGGAITLTGEGTPAEKLPAYLVAAMESVVEALSSGNRVAVVDEGGVLSTAQGAKLAGVSKALFEELLHDGQIPSFKYGDLLRVNARDVLAFLEKREARTAALDALDDEIIAAGVSQRGHEGR